jgi:DNA topoisomerase-1
MRLIVTEKNNSAKKIAEALSNGSNSEDKTFKVPFYAWTDGEGNEHMTVGLKGHVLGPAFPEGYSNWQKTDLHDLIDAQLVKEPTDKNVVKAIKKLAKEADELVIATDFDREGELIGLEALEEMLDANPALGTREETDAGTLQIQRARYSALTKEEIDRAFNELDELSYPLANAGAARQDIDLLWGATLTRAVSLASRRFGSNFLSVGRVQSPTLGLIVEREMERRAHVAKPFWEVFAKFDHPDGSFEAHHTVDKFWEKAEADAALAGTASPGTVKAVTARKNTRKPPTPYNTTAFSTDASSRLGITPASAMRIAEDLYMDGFISYPRTDNTVYPSSLPVRELVSSLTRIKEFSAASGLLEGELKPTRGKKETTDHPPIYPTQAVHPGALDGSKKRVYELVVRRFLATFSPPMITESTRATPASTPTRAPPTTRSPPCRRARSWRSPPPTRSARSAPRTSTPRPRTWPTPGRSARRPSPRAGSRRRN